MILDRLDKCSQYKGLHQGLDAGFAFLHQPGLADLPAGRHAIDGDRLYVMIVREDGRGHDGAKLEAHRNYIDIQLTLSGAEQIGWRATSECRDCTDPYTSERDLVFFGDRPETWLDVPPGKFAIFFPGDAHAPLGGAGALHKAVVKVRVEW